MNIYWWCLKCAFSSCFFFPCILQFCAFVEYICINLSNNNLVKYMQFHFMVYIHCVFACCISWTYCVWILSLYGIKTTSSKKWVNSKAPSITFHYKKKKPGVIESLFTCCIFFKFIFSFRNYQFWAISICTERGGIGELDLWMEMYRSILVVLSGFYHSMLISSWWCDSLYIVKLAVRYWRLIEFLYPNTPATSTVWFLCFVRLHFTYTEYTLLLNATTFFNFVGYPIFRLA